MKYYFSIIIPVLNEEKYLPRLLECIVNQKERDYELIVVDGKSEDQTKENAQKYKKQFPHFSFLEVTKRNVSYQRNEGAKIAQGEYLIFFDADVMIEPLFLQTLKRVLQKQHFLLCTTNIVPDEKKLHKKFITLIANIGRDIFLVLGRAYAGGFNHIIRKDLFFTLGGYDERIVYAEDVELLDRAHKKGVLMKNLHTPTLIYSFRRFEQFGYLPVIRILLGSMILEFLGVKYGTREVDYPMDGKLYKEKKRL
jgi:glycosyltransferase involved in cell wall biosynthesis